MKLTKILEDLANEVDRLRGGNYASKVYVEVGLPGVSKQKLDKSFSAIPKKGSKADVNVTVDRIEFKKGIIYLKEI